MRHRLALAMAALVLAACAGGQPAPSPSPSLTPAPAPTPTPPGSAELWLRATQVQALPPQQRFGWLPLAAITADLTLVVPGPMIEIYPGPLVPNLLARPITERGWAAIVDEARALGLLDGRTDFLPEDVAPGQALGRVELLVDGVRFDLTGDPTRLVRCGGARCIPTPGTPEAFAAFWQRVVDLPSWLAGEVGSEVSYVAPAYAILVGPPPSELPPQPQVLVWPLEAGLGTFGRPVGADQLPRCGTLRGAEADAVRPVLLTANELTQWVDDVTTSVTFGIDLRPLLPGEDVCAELFGG
jgi:hypothetical protein